MSSHPKQRQGIVNRHVAGESVALDRRGRKLHQMNATASCIWELCDGNHSVDEIVNHVVARFNADRELVEGHVVGAIGQLANLGLLEDTQAQATG